MSEEGDHFPLRAKRVINHIKEGYCNTNVYQWNSLHIEPLSRFQVDSQNLVSYGSTLKNQQEAGEREEREREKQNNS